MNAHKLHIISEPALQAFAAAFATHLRLGDCLALEGNLGTGKTSFTRAIIQSLQPEIAKDEVPSPTFTLVQTYQVILDHRAVALWHYDLYRLQQPDDLVELALEEALQHAITVIEWPAIARNFLPKDTLFITIEHQPDGSRIWSFEGSERWECVFSVLKKSEWTWIA